MRVLCLYEHDGRGFADEPETWLGAKVITINWLTHTDLVVGFKRALAKDLANWNQHPSYRPPVNARLVGYLVDTQEHHFDA